ncbi:hypothetical protein CJ030_MR3G005772 [Morella rubra]|uniref:Myb/SANT-like domain-containing protein n=1 Tax=Morella rubra TaxID=262757 RepID=A0A6A1W4C5_9ROSI|nr:hypothetical protein CJ030_MR3G005772 [Morella rubra]
MDRMLNRYSYAPNRDAADALVEEAITIPPANNTNAMAIKQRFQRIADIINHRYNDLNVTAEQVHGHYTDMEQEYHALTHLLNTKGFFWDKESNAVVATDARLTHLRPNSVIRGTNTIASCSEYLVMSILLQQLLLCGPLVDVSLEQTVRHCEGTLTAAVGIGKIHFGASLRIIQRRYANHANSSN